MRFLLDANMPCSTLAVFAEHGHTAKHVRDTGMGDAPDKEIAAQARADIIVALGLEPRIIVDYGPLFGAQS